MKQQEQVLNRKEWSPMLKEPLRARKFDDPYAFEGNNLNTVDGRPFAAAISTESQEGSKNAAPASLDSPRSA